MGEVDAVLTPRVIPVLQLLDGWLVKTKSFDTPRYLGDPINAVKIFNEMQVDELVVCDIGSSRRRGGIDFRLVEDVVSEAFMPVAYGGGVRTLEDARTLVDCGVEKIVLSTAVLEVPGILEELSSELGSQSVVVSVDFRRGGSGRAEVFVRSATVRTGRGPLAVAQQAVASGAGEILVNSVDREQSWQGYDLTAVDEIARAVEVPVVALGGAASIRDFRDGLEAGASAVAAGSMFSFFGPHRAVLITYPEPAELRTLLNKS